MIAARPLACFEEFEFSENNYTLSFYLSIGSVFRERVCVDLPNLPGMADLPLDKMWVSVGADVVCIFHGPRGDFERSQEISSFSPDRLIWLRSHELPGIGGLDQFRQAATYDLLYVGIAKVGDTFDRLIKRGHKARMDILSNEPQRSPGALVSDEIVLFMFKADGALLKEVIEGDENQREDDFKTKRLIVDAEKAFVSLLTPEYNYILYKHFPKGQDGLYKAGYTQYSYSIRENLIFNTPGGTYRGGRVVDSPFGIGDGQSLLVRGNRVDIVDDLLEASKRS